MNDIQSGSPVQQDVKMQAADHLLYIAIKYKAAIIGILVLLVCLGAGTFFWIRHQQTSEQEAALKLSKIAPLLDSKNYRLAINGEEQLDGLKKITESYANTPSGNMAALMLANAYYSIGEYDSALKAFKSVSVGNSDLAAAALAGTGACLVNKNQYAQAAESYENASKKAENSALKSLYLAHAADSYRQAARLPKATELYKKIIAEWPGSTGAAMAQRSLWQISGKL